MLVASSAMHVIAHYYNYERLLATPTFANYQERFPEVTRRIPNDAQPDLANGVQPVSLISGAGIGIESSPVSYIIYPFSL